MKMPWRRGYVARGCCLYLILSYEANQKIYTHYGDRQSPSESVEDTQKIPGKRPKPTLAEKGKGRLTCLAALCYVWYPRRDSNTRPAV